MYRISKEFHFSASHVLNGMRPGHPCGRLHGHNYVVILELSAPELDILGMVLDYNDLAPFKTWIDDVLDHRHLNDVMPSNPTAENLAKFIYDSLGSDYRRLVTSVTVKETAKTCATYSP